VSEGTGSEGGRGSHQSTKCRLMQKYQPQMVVMAAGERWSPWAPVGQVLLSLDLTLEKNLLQVSHTLAPSPLGYPPGLPFPVSPYGSSLAWLCTMREA
jgi:hypothetical protein